MADSTTHLDLLSTSQVSKETVANQLFDAMSPNALFGRRGSTTAGLTWGYYGGVALVDGEPVEVANGTVTLTASATNYLYAEVNESPEAWTVVKTTSPPVGWPGPMTGKVALYQIVTGASTVTSYEDKRAAAIFSSAAAGGATGQIQYNSGGSLAGDSRLTFDATNKVAAGQFTADSGAINAQTGTTYTLQATDNGKVVTLSNASPITVTVPSGLGAGFSCICIQIGSGQVTFAASGTTINPSGTLKIAIQHGAASLIAYVANTFNLSGNISA